MLIVINNYHNGVWKGILREVLQDSWFYLTVMTIKTIKQRLLF